MDINEDLKLNEKASRILEDLEGLEGAIFTEYADESGTTTLIDLGVETCLDIEPAEYAGIKVAEASMGCLGTVRRKGDVLNVEIPKHPAIATLGCQLAGWSIEIDGKCAIGSGPARIPARKPGRIIDLLGYAESPETAVIVLETKNLPDTDACASLLEKTGASRLLIAAFRDDSMTGLMNVLARIVEVGVFRLHNLGFDAGKVQSARGTVPIPPLDENIMYTANDAIIYGGTVELKVSGWDPSLTEKAVSKSSPDYKRPFKEIFNSAGGDFYKIDPGIFAPARMEIRDTLDDKTYSSGEPDYKNEGI